jgi:hypothetical protein
MSTQSYYQQEVISVYKISTIKIIEILKALAGNTGIYIDNYFVLEEFLEIWPEPVHDDYTRY